MVAVFPIATLLIPTGSAADRLEFTRLIAHWAGYGDPGYLPFVEEAKPDVAQVGFYGAHFWSLAHTSSYGGYPAHLPVRGLQDCGDWFARLNSQLHQRGVKVVGHFNVKFLVGDPDSPEGPRGFFKFYRDHWDESLLGPKPVADPLDFLEKDHAGKPISNNSYSIGGMREYWACLNNPHWRAVLKAWLRVGVQRGADGFIANYFYRHDCHCEHCVDGFRQYLRQRFSPDDLKQRFDIADLALHRFNEIVAWHDPAQSTPLRREMLRFSQVANKQAFDEVFVRYGRSLKPDLIVAQWNHLGDFNQINGDERCLLPTDLWGKDEDYLWYSTGDAANWTDLSAGFLGEGTLQARYIRGAFDDRPFTLGKYESVRIRAAIAELAANGGAPMGFYTAFEDPEARREIVRYYRFLKQNETLYRANRSHAEALLLYPRRRVHEGDPTAVARFKSLGKQLLDRHVLFDVVPDDWVQAMKQGRSVASDGNSRAGNRNERHPEGQYALVLDPSETPSSITNALRRLSSGFSRFDAPATVRVSSSIPVQSDEITLHFVNYNREEPAEKRNPGNGIKDEKPIATRPFAADVKLGSKQRAVRLEFLTPESEQGRALEFSQSESLLRFRVPEFLVYAVVRVHLRQSDEP